MSRNYPDQFDPPKKTESLRKSRRQLALDILHEQHEFTEDHCVKPVNEDNSETNEDKVRFQMSPHQTLDNIKSPLIHYRQ